MLTDEAEGEVTASGELLITLEGHQGKSYLLT